MFTCTRILFLVSLLFVALLDPFDPYSPFKFLIFYSSCHNKSLLFIARPLVNMLKEYFVSVFTARLSKFCKIQKMHGELFSISTIIVVLLYL